jgi:hypothetical protein
MRLRLCAALALIVPALWAQSPAPQLTLKAGDVRVESRDDGFHLFVRQLAGVKSVMLVEAFELPDHKLATYSWKALGDYPSGAKEKRLLNGKALKGPNQFLISSTAKTDERFGSSFEIVIPPVIEWGNTAPGSRYGKVNVTEELAKAGGKVWFSIRLFAKPYEDYRGAYKDNAFELSTMLVVADLAPDHGKYVKGAEDLFRRLGPTEKALDPTDGIKRLKATLSDDLDLVWAIDLTKSMKQNILALNELLVPQLDILTAGFSHFRLGFVFYRDYQEKFLTRPVPLTANRETWKRELLAATTDAGGDIPEAVIEAMDAGLDLFDVATVNRKLVIYADAPQHDVARGKVLETTVLERAKAAGVSLQFLLLPLTTF